MRTWNLGELAHFLQGEVIGDATKIVSRTCAPDSLSFDGVCFIEKAVQLDKLKDAVFGAIILSAEHSAKMDALEFVSVDRIVHNHPKLAFAWAQIAFYAPEGVKLPAQAQLDNVDPCLFVGGEWRMPKEISSRASVSELASIAENVEIGAFSVVEDGARIEEGTIVYPNSYIGKNVHIGKNCRIFPNVTIYPETQIGNNVYIHSGTIIGADGFGFVSHASGHTKLAQTGRVVIEDNVEIGSSCCIDRAAVTETVIENGVKLDNLIQIAHGCRIGKNTLIASQTGLSGSMDIGKWCIIGGQAGFAGHAKVGDGSIIAAQSGVFHDLPAKSRVSGYPARSHAHQLKVLTLIHKLPEYIEKLKALIVRVQLLESDSVVNNDRKDASTDNPNGNFDKDKKV